MTTDQWFAIITLSFTAAFTALLLWFAWSAFQAWRASRVKHKREERILDETEYFTPDWEAEIRKISMRYSDKINCEQARCNQIIHNLKRDWADDNLKLRKRRTKEEAGTDNV